MKNKVELKSWFEDDKLYVGEYVKHKINQLDEPEVLSQEFINEKAVEVYADTADAEVHAVFRIRDLQNLLVPKQEKVDRAYKDGYEKGKQHTFYKGYLEGLADKGSEPETLSQEWINKHTDKFVSNWDLRFVSTKDLQNLLVPKQELPTIPKFVADWIEACKEFIDYDGSTINIFDSQHETDTNLPLLNTTTEKERGKVYDWIADYSEKYARAWLDGYTVEEEQKYYAKIKGHENIGSDDKYWNYCITDESLDIGDNKVHADVLAEYVLNATKDEWENLGINDDNADFIKVEELEE